MNLNLCVVFYCINLTRVLKKIFKTFFFFLKRKTKNHRVIDNSLCKYTRRQCKNIDREWNKYGNEHFCDDDKKTVNQF